MTMTMMMMMTNVEGDWDIQNMEGKKFDLRNLGFLLCILCFDLSSMNR